MKSILVFNFLLLMFSFKNVYASDSVKLIVGLGIEKVCPNNIPFCDVVSGSVTYGDTEITLIAQDGTLVCDPDDSRDTDTDTCELKDVTHYRGVDAKIFEMDGLRVIGITSVDKNIISSSVGGQTAAFTSYQVTVEIMGENGVVAKFKINHIDDMKKINLLTLMAPELMRNGTKYIPTLTLGPAVDLNCIPLPDSNCMPEMFHNNDVDLIMGSLR